MLTAEQIRARENRVTGSFVTALIAGNDAAIMREWQRIVGDPDYEPEDFSNNWPVNKGQHDEPFVIDWHERKTGHALTRRGETVVHPARPFFSVTLDCYRADDDTVLDVKSTGAFRPIDEIESYYAAQVIAQMRCTGANNGAL